MFLHHPTSYEIFLQEFPRGIGHITRRNIAKAEGDLFGVLLDHRDEPERPRASSAISTSAHQTLRTSVGKAPRSSRDKEGSAWISAGVLSQFSRPARVQGVGGCHPFARKRSSSPDKLSTHCSTKGSSQRTPVMKQSKAARGL